MADYILRNVKHGSIVLMHMPERGFRQHILPAMQRVLEGLAARGLHGQTLSTMSRLSLGHRSPP